MLKNGASVVICKTTSSNNGTVQTWFNNGYVPIVVDLANPNLGLSNTRISAASGFLQCNFTRQNSIMNSKYYNLNNMSTPFIIVAFGSGKILRFF